MPFPTETRVSFVRRLPKIRGTRVFGLSAKSFPSSSVRTELVVRRTPRTYTIISKIVTRSLSKWAHTSAYATRWNRRERQNVPGRFEHFVSSTHLLKTRIRRERKAFCFRLPLRATDLTKLRITIRYRHIFVRSTSLDDDRRLSIVGLQK